MNRYAKPENFASPIRTPLLREHFVYRAFDKDGQLLYIGCSRDPRKRLSEHRFSSQWYPLMARMALAGPYNYETARQVEYDAIESERSLFNYSSERRELHRIYSNLVTSEVDRLVTEGVDPYAATPLAIERVDALPLLANASGNGPLRIDDTTLPRARRVAADFIKERAA